MSQGIRLGVIGNNVDGYVNSVDNSGMGAFDWQTPPTDFTSSHLVHFPSAAYFNADIKDFKLAVGLNGAGTYGMICRRMNQNAYQRSVQVDPIGNGSFLAVSGSLTRLNVGYYDMAGTYTMKISETDRFGGNPRVATHQIRVYDHLDNDLVINGPKLVRHDVDWTYNLSQVCVELV